MTIDYTKVTQIYSGKNRHCCCGCAGKHTNNDGTHDRAIKSHVTKMNRLIQEGCEVDIVEDVYTAVVSGKRLYIAYFDKR